MLDLDWLGAMRRCAEAQKLLFDAQPTVAGRTVYEGVGEGGDHALALDRRCEDIVFAALEQLHEGSGHDFVAVSEERGEVAFGDAGSPWRVVIDPIDGSLNTRRTIPAHSLSVAIASGPSMADVEWGFVHDFGSSEEFVARRGAGARLNGSELRAEGPGYGLELVGLESADPKRIAPVISALAGRAYRVRVIGSIAIALSYVAAGRLDAMMSVRACRSVDAAAAQLVVTEAGGEVEFVGFAPDEADLGLDARYPVLAGLDPEMLGAAREVQELAPQT
jgi:myo-inositol-1(or 4)-monophosphatase